MQRKASAHWQGSTTGRQRHAVRAERHAARHAVFVQGALRRRQGHEPRGADRGRARRLLHDGAVVHAEQRRHHRRLDRHRGRADDGRRRRQADDHGGPPRHAREGAGHRCREVRRIRDRREVRLRRLARACPVDQGDAGRRAAPERARWRASRRRRPRAAARHSIRRTASAATRARRSTTAGQRHPPDEDDALPPTADSRADRARAHDHRAQRFARHPVQPVDQSVPGLRARLHLLLRPADARLSRPLAGHRLRDEALRETRRGGAAQEGAREARLRLRSDRARQPTPIRTSRSSANGRSRAASSRCSRPATIR